jgi:AcrR family transcriptional regulator
MPTYAPAREVPIDCPGRHAGFDRRSQVLRTAALQFAMTGLRGTSIRTLAEAVGISESTLYMYFDSKECLFREIVRDNIKSRLQLLEARTTSAVYGSETDAIRAIAEATVTVGVAGVGSSILTNWALLEDPEFAAELYRNEMGSVEIVWDRALAECILDPRSRRILSVHLVPYAVSSCLAYGFWIATLRHDAERPRPLQRDSPLG